MLICNALVVYDCTHLSVFLHKIEVYICNTKNTYLCFIRKVNADESIFFNP